MQNSLLRFNEEKLKKKSEKIETRFFKFTFKHAACLSIILVDKPTS